MEEKCSLWRLDYIEGTFSEFEREKLHIYNALLVCDK
jgi:hypothetical protein